MILGIDPGLTGALVWLTRGGVVEDVQVMPAQMCGTKRTLVSSDLLVLLKSRRVRLVAIEQAQTRPLLAANAVLTTGTNYGLILGMLSALEIPFEVIVPRTWTGAMHLGQPQSAKPKEKSLLVAQRLFPKVKLIPPGHRVPHDGIVDALLIAEYARRRHAL